LLRNKIISAILLLITAAFPGAAAVFAATGAGSALEPRAAVAAMKQAPRGPFARIRWFCKDGSVLPPQPYACKERGGGSQHGEWTEQVKALRADGYLLANVYSDLDVDAFVARDDAAQALGQMLIEQFLIRIDDGWVLRQARYYRGALQEEGERAGGRRLLYRLAQDPQWLQRRYLLLRTAARLVPHGGDTHSAAEVRQLASDLARRDPDFATLRNKIHVRPERGDAAAVRGYAARMNEPALAADYARLAEGIDQVYSPGSVLAALQALAGALDQVPELQARVTAAAADLQTATQPAERLRLSAALLVLLRDELVRPNGPRARVAMLDASLAVEDEFYAVASTLPPILDGASRRELLGMLEVAVDAVYGAGLISARQRAALADARARIAGEAPSVAAYKDLADYLGRVPAWGTQALRLHFGVALERYLALEPLAGLFVQDHARGGALFVYAALVERLGRDAQHLAGVGHELFGEPAGAGLRSLNPGLARGVLHVAGSGTAVEAFDADGIYLLPETVAELPPVAGILTAGEGNPLSHVQLLARNLGIPNVAVDGAIVPRLARFESRRVVLAVSPGGSVRLVADDGSLDHLFTVASEPQALIRPDLDKLDLERRALIGLEALRAPDSGRIVGPKAAKLGELRHHYPQAVARGVAIPFGVFREVLARPYRDSGMSAFDWMVDQYAMLARLPAGSQERREATAHFRTGLEAWVAAARPGPALRAGLRAWFTEHIGPDGSFGVFVRSDTNVEDLPGFTGAGLNLTVPNVVGIDAIIKAIPRVWASPFSERAFAWRQAHMEQPEHVYPAVLLLESVAVEKSGVLVTRDVDTGAAGWISVAVNEGVGGAVDGQAAESLRIHLDSGRVRLLAQATAPTRRVLNPAGGVTVEPASGADRVLQSAEIRQLIAFVRDLPARFPPIVDDAGAPAAADVEFGFLGGALKLFQIRPFLESRRARGSAYLASLDALDRDLNAIRVDLDGRLATGSLAHVQPTP